MAQKYLTANYNDLDFSSDIEQLRDAVMISLFTWRRANAGDLPTTDFQYGWWADSYNDINIGSRLYLIIREKITDALIPKIDSICKEALQWLLDDQVVSEIIINSRRTAIHTVETNITLIRNSETLFNMDFSNIWEGY